VSIEHGARADAGFDARRSVGVPDNSEIGRRDPPQSQLSRKKFAAGFLPRETPRQARDPARAVARIRKLLFCEQAPEFFRCLVQQQLFDTCQFDGVEAAPGWLREFGFHAPEAAFARTTSATFIPPNPRQQITAVSLR